MSWVIQVLEAPDQQEQRQQGNQGEATLPTPRTQKSLFLTLQDQHSKIPYFLLEWGFAIAVSLVSSTENISSPSFYSTKWTIPSKHFCIWFFPHNLLWQHERGCDQPVATCNLWFIITKEASLVLFLNSVAFTQWDISCIILKIHYQTLNAVLDNSEVVFLLFQKLTERQQQATAKGNSHSSPTNTRTYLFYMLQTCHVNFIRE